MRCNLRVAMMLSLAVAVFASTAMAETLPNPYVYLKMDGNLTNSGSAGANVATVVKHWDTATSSYVDGYLPNTTAPYYNEPQWVEGKDGQALFLNPSVGADVATKATTTSATTAASTYGDVTFLATDLTSAIGETSTPAFFQQGTIQFWYKTGAKRPTSGSPYEELFCNSGHYNRWEAYMGGKDGQLACRLGDSVNSVDTGFFTSADTWYNFAFTWDWDAAASTASLQVYVNGDQKYTGTVTCNAAPGKTFYLSGNYGDYGTGTYGNTGNIGKYDEVRFYDTALTATQVASAMAVPEPSALTLLLSVVTSIVVVAWKNREWR